MDLCSKCYKGDRNSAQPGIGHIVWGARPYHGGGHSGWNVVYTSVEYLQKMKSSQAENGDSGDTSKLLEQFGLLSPSESRLHDEAEDNEEKEKKDEDPEKEKKEEIEDTSDNTFLPSDMPVQKNRKRCWNCKVKLELAQRALGSCKCGKT